MFLFNTNIVKTGTKKMIIPKTIHTNQNFNAFIRYKNKSGIPLREHEQIILNRVKSVLENKQGKHINIITNILPPSETHPNTKRIQFITAPLQEDLLKIQQQRKDAKITDYMKGSTIMDLKAGLEWDAMNYTNKYISYVQACIKDPNRANKKEKKP